MTDDFLFEPWPKIGRVEKRHAIATEKIDGTNAQILIRKVDGSQTFNPNSVATVVEPYNMVTDQHAFVYEVFAGSRKRLITPDQDNAGFAYWVRHHARDLVEILGEGRHFGEWWGDGIQKNPLQLDPGERRFSLFNTKRWRQLYLEPELGGSLTCVPVLAQWGTVTGALREALAALEINGSFARKGAENPEGVVVYEVSSQTMYKHIIGSTGPKSAQ